MTSVPEYLIKTNEEKHFVDKLYQSLNDENEKRLFNNLVNKKKLNSRKDHYKPEILEVQNLLHYKPRFYTNPFNPEFKDTQINDKNYLYDEKDLSKYMNFKVKPNFKEAGKVLGNKMKDFANFLQNLDNDQISDIVNNKTFTFENIEIDSSLIEVKTESKEGMSSIVDNNNFIILNTTLTEDLIEEGLAREIVSKVQNLRKEKDFDIENRIKLYYKGNEQIDKVFKNYEDYIKKETLSLELIKKDDLSTIYNINDNEVCLDVERVE